jgi:hypothetical protein
MANNFNDATVAIANNSLTDIYTATNKSLVIAGTISNTTTTSMNVTMKKYDSSATTSYSIFTNVPLTSGSSLELPKVILQTSDKIQVQTDDASGNCTVALQLLTDVS